MRIRRNSSIGGGAKSWLLFGIIITALVLAVIFNYIGTVLVGLFVYYATRPFYTRIDARIGRPTLSSIASLLLVILPVVILGIYTLGIALRELNRIIETYDISILQEWGTTVLGDATISELLSLIQSPSETITNGLSPTFIESILNVVLNSVGVIANVLLNTFIVFVIAFYLLRDGHKFKQWALSTFHLRGTVTEKYLYAIDRDFHRIFFGNILNAVVTGAIAAIVYSLINVTAPAGYSISYPTLIGVLCGVASLIPVVGMKLVYFPVAAQLFIKVWLDGSLDYLWFPSMFFIISAVVIDMIPDFVLRPYISGRELHVGSIMLAYIVGPMFFGWYGLFLGPIVLVLFVHFNRIVLPVVLREIRTTRFTR